MHKDHINELAIDITSSCNAKCPFCPREIIKNFHDSRPHKYMSLEFFKSIIDEAKSVGVKYIRLYWFGEPTLHEYIGEFIKYVKKSSMYCDVSTNAMMLEKHFKSLIKVDNVRYSIDGWDKESFNLLRKGLDFEKVLKNVKEFYQYRNIYNENLKISLNLVYSKKTDLKKFFDLWSDYVDEITINPMYPSMIFNKLLNKFELVREKNLEEYYFDFKKKDYDYYSCAYLNNTMIINYNGDIPLCCDDIRLDVKCGNVNDGLLNVFNNKIFNNVRKELQSKDLQVCQNCNQFYEIIDEQKYFIKNNILACIDKYSFKNDTKVIVNI